MIVVRELSKIGLLFGLLLVAISVSMAAIRVDVNVRVLSYSGSEVRNLVAPIALYPDPLLAIILPASTYPDQVSDAANMDYRGYERAIDRQNWDISVRALAHYPILLRKMANNFDWTAALGQAYVEQPQHVMDAIQMLREQAFANGVLRSTREQRIFHEGHYLRIVPAQSVVIYIPQYNPDVVYSERRPNNSQTLMVFGTGLIIGVWLSNDTDWTNHRVYNHGWQGGGWVAKARPHVTVNNIYIINRDHPAIVNRNVLQRQIDRKKVNNYNTPMPRPNVKHTATNQQRVQASPARKTYSTLMSTLKRPAAPERKHQDKASKDVTQRKAMPDHQMQGNDKAYQKNTAVGKDNRSDRKHNAAGTDDRTDQNESAADKEDKKKDK